MQMSVLIPTRARPDKLRACLAALADQTIARTGYEVLVGVDGAGEADTDTEQIAAAADPLKHAGINHKVLPCLKVGPGPVRNRLLAHARGRTILMLNDDVAPAHDLLERHLRALADLGRRGVRALVVGSAPWRVHPDQTLFEAMLERTSAVFFYDQMRARLADDRHDPDHDWGYRHAWTLNLSCDRGLLPTEITNTFNEDLRGAMYEDLEMAWRVTREQRARVVYRPEAIVTHDHRMSLESYLDRERRMGASALHATRADPEFTRDVFSRDITAHEQIEASHRLVRDNAERAERLRTVLSPFAARPVRDLDLDGPALAGLCASLYHTMLPLKRWTWNDGLCRAHQTEARAHDPITVRHPGTLQRAS